jgi:hypothetical protein
MTSSRAMPAAQVLVSGTVPAGSAKFSGAMSSGVGALQAAQVLHFAGTEPAPTGVMSEAAGLRTSDLVTSLNQVIRDTLPVSQHAVALTSNRLAQLVSAGHLGRGTPGTSARAEELCVASEFHAGGSSSTEGPQVGHFVMRAPEGEITYSRDVVRGVRRHITKSKAKRKPRA